jgi:rhodanese-related sulfurtransferase
MKNYRLLTVAIIFIAIGLAVFLKPTREIDTADKHGGDKISSIINEGGQLIDVRTPEEYQSGHADDAINIPIDDILAGDLSKINKNKAIYLYCRSGNRANQVKVFLENKGYKNVVNLGGLSELTQDGGKVCSSTRPAC